MSEGKELARTDADSMSAADALMILLWIALGGLVSLLSSGSISQTLLILIMDEYDLLDVDETLFVKEDDENLFFFDAEPPLELASVSGPSSS